MLAKSVEKRSSGLRIDRASDDARATIARRTWSIAVAGLAAATWR
jgi:flagellin-like hook-associated protein FlgL